MTLFSAPNYCNEYDNAGGIMKVNEQLFCSFQVGICSSISQLHIFLPVHMHKLSKTPNSLY